MANVHDQCGEPIRRLGQASVKRALADPVSITGGGPKDYAGVFDDDTGISITRYKNEGYTVTWWEKDDSCCEKSFTKANEAITLFLEKVKHAKGTSKKDDAA